MLQLRPYLAASLWHRWSRNWTDLPRMWKQVAFEEVFSLRGPWRRYHAILRRRDAFLLARDVRFRQLRPGAVGEETRWTKRN